MAKVVGDAGFSTVMVGPYHDSRRPARALVHGLERPVFAYGWQIAERAGSGNGDGRVQRGEQLTMYVTVKNVGPGRSFLTRANIRNLSGEGVLLHDARFNVDNMAPGEERRVVFTFDVASNFHENEAKLELELEDEDLREIATQRIRIPISGDSTAVTPLAGTFTASAPVNLLEWGAQGARVVMHAAAGQAFTVKGQMGDFD